MYHRFGLVAAAVRGHPVGGGDGGGDPLAVARSLHDGGGAVGCNITAGVHAGNRGLEGLGIGLQVAAPRELGYLISEEVEPQTLFQTRREDVDDRASQRIFTVINHCIGARLALPLKKR